MAHLQHFIVFQQHLDDIETDAHGGEFQKPEIVESGPREPSPPANINRRRGASPILRGSRLDLHEYQAIRIPEDQIDLTAIRAKICRKELHARPLQVLSSNTLT